uniref:Protein TIC 214 n=1 Tax=Stephania dielsiana TaxID=1501458 RepID=A0A7T0NC68_9MAGN|nr:hypothetical protein RF1 [Stephania dielsiana]QPK42033.1 hypothetical protein RF1 [Stephania dielsiana]
MILKSFLLGNPLCMKIINSVVVVGFYYGFTTTFSIGPSYLFLLRARLMEEGTEREVSATTGFITGQLLMFISIYYAPLYLALSRPHTITVLALLYLLLHFFWNNHNFFFDYGSGNSMRNLSIHCVFLNNLIFQLFNHFILPSSTLARLVNISMFQCNNKMFFVTSSFVGWLIGHTFLMKWVELAFFWIRQNPSISSNKYFVSELKNNLARIFRILLFITCVYYLGRMPSPIFTKKLKKKEANVDIEKTSETKGTKQEQEGSTQEDPSISFDSGERVNKIDETEEIQVNGNENKMDEIPLHFQETSYKNSPVSKTSYRNSYQKNPKFEILKDKKKKDLFWFEKPLVNLLFDYKRWNRPLRYIKNARFENAVRNEMSQYFFYTCQSDGKQRISFTYPPSLSTFLEMIQRKMFLYAPEKLVLEELSNRWVYTNEKKKNNLSNEFFNRIEALDRGFLALDVLEKRTRLCDDETEQKCLPKIDDPFLNGSYRGTIKELYSRSSINDDFIISIEDSIETIGRNKFHYIFTADYPEFELTNIDNPLTSIKEITGESPPKLKDPSLFLLSEQGKFSYSENKAEYFFTAVTTDFNDQTTRKKSIGLKEISKKVPRWAYKLTDDLKEQERENEEESTEDRGIRSRKAKRVVIFTDNEQNANTNTVPQNTSNRNPAAEVALIRYSQQSDFRRDLIKGSMRTQRRKTVTWELFQSNVHSPLFLDRIDKKPFFFAFDISGMVNSFFRNFTGKGVEFKTSDFEEEEAREQDKKTTEKREENERIAIAETWDTLLFAQAIRGSMLVTQSILRKYIVLPSLIIAKNLCRMLLFQFPEWYEDLKAWNREMHVKCTYNGVQLSEKEFPKNWLIDGIQIKILFPFRLKPWHKSKLRSQHRETIKKKGKKANFFFLTVWGMETDQPFGSPRKQPSFFEPIFKEFETKLRKVKKKCFIALKILKERVKWVLKVSKEKTRWVIQTIQFLKRIMKDLAKRNPILLFGLREVYESSQNENNGIIIRNPSTHESYIQIRSADWTNSLLTDKKTTDLSDRTITIRNQIEKITKDRKKKFLTLDIKISPNKTNCDNIKVELPKKIWQILKGKSTRAIRKWHYFMQFLIVIEKTYTDTLLFIINITRINVQPFLESKKIIEKSNYNDKTTQEGIEETNLNTIHYISTIKKPLSNISKKNSQTLCDLSSLSQAYVFYKLSQTQVINKYHLKSVLQYQGTSLFLKSIIRDCLKTQKIFHFGLRHKKLQKFGMNDWKGWLRGHYHYQHDLSQTRWFRLVPQKWRNRVNQSCLVQNKDSVRFDSYEKDRLINYQNYQKKNDYVVDSLPSQKAKFKRNYRYDLLSHKYMNYADNKDSYLYGSPLQGNEVRGIPQNYNTYNPEFCYVPGDIVLSDYLREDSIIETDKNTDRKFVDWRLLHFCLRKKSDIEGWNNRDIGTTINQNTQSGTDYYQIIDKMDKKDLIYLASHKQINSSNQRQNPFDWMGMNEKKFNCHISSLQLWFFPEFVLLYNTYKIQPWIVPINLLLLNFNGNENVSEKKNINRTKKKDLRISSNQKKSLELEVEDKNQKEKQQSVQDQVDRGSDAQNQGNLASDISNQQKDVKENYEGSDTRNKKQSKRNTAAELDLFLKRYFLFQLRWDDPLNPRIINNIKVYCLLLRLINPKEIAIYSIQREEMSLDVMLIQKDLTLKNLIIKGILIIEPVRLSIKWNGQFIMYQAIAISLVHKSKHQTQTNGKCREKRNVYKNGLDESISRHKRVIGNRDENHYDLLVPENILSPRRRREFRIRICFNSEKVNVVVKNLVFPTGNNEGNRVPFLDESKHFDIDNISCKFKFFVWPNYRLEDLASMNRYWFDTNNGSRFSLSRIHMYPRLKFR